MGRNMFTSVSRGDDGECSEFPQSMRHLFGPTQIDNSISQAIQMCWMSLPEEQRSIDEVERQIMRLVAHALQNARDDFEAFGFDKS